jgi:hypothetical protein
MGNALTIKSNFPNDKELANLFGLVPMLQRQQVAQQAVREGAKPVVKRAKELAPRSKPEDTRKRSKKQKASADWNKKLHASVGSVTRGSGVYSFAIIGPRYPVGNKAYFNAPRSGARRIVAWGRDTGRSKRATRNWVVQAFDETRSQQLSAMKSKIRERISEGLG